MTWQIVIVLTTLVLIFGIMVFGWLREDVAALFALCIFLITGILTAEEIFQVFSNAASVTIASMFILGAALDYTGAIEWVGHRLDRLIGKSELSLLLVMLPLIAFLSAFINNTPVIVVFLPIMISLAARRNIKSSKLLIPMSYASIIGGCCTLIGTSTNILVSSSAEKLGVPPIAMFELGKLGLILAVAGFFYLLIVARHLLPEKGSLSSNFQEKESQEYFTEAVIVAGSPLIGKKWEKTPFKSSNSRIISVMRDADVFLGVKTDDG